MNKKLIVLLAVLICSTMGVKGNENIVSGDTKSVENIKNYITLRNELLDSVETLLKQLDISKEYIKNTLSRDMPNLEQSLRQRIVDHIWKMRTKHSGDVKSNPRGCAEQIIQDIGLEQKVQVVEYYSREDILKLAEQGAEFYRISGDIDGIPVYARKPVSVQQRSPQMENILNNSVQAQVQKTINNTASTGLKEARKDQRMQGENIEAGITGMAGRQHEKEIEKTEAELANAQQKAKDAVKNAREEKKKSDTPKTEPQQSSAKKDNQKAGNTQIPDSSNPKGNNTPNPLDPNTDDIDDPLLPPDYEGTSPQSKGSFPEGNNTPAPSNPNANTHVIEMPPINIEGARSQSTGSFSKGNGIPNVDISNTDGRGNSISNNAYESEIDPATADQINRDAVLYGKQMKERYRPFNPANQLKEPVKFVSRGAGILLSRFTKGISMAAAEWACNIVDDVAKDEVAKSDAYTKEYQEFAEEYYRAMHRYAITHNEKEFDKIPGVRLYHTKYKTDYIMPELEKNNK